MKLSDISLSTIVILLNVVWLADSRNVDLQQRRSHSAARRRAFNQRQPQSDQWVPRSDSTRQRPDSRLQEEDDLPSAKRKDSRTPKGKLQRRKTESNLESLAHGTDTDNRKKSSSVPSGGSDFMETRSGQEQEAATMKGKRLTPGHWCPPCDFRHCPLVSPETCSGTIRKDFCDCCPVCDWQEDMVQPQQPSPTMLVVATPSDNATGELDACEQITCTKHQVCMLNIQGIPMCRCPSTIYCKKGDRNPLCGEDGITYKSRCYLKAAECETGQNIAVSHKGRCEGNKNRKKQQRMEERVNHRREKQMMKTQRQQAKQEKMEKLQKRLDKLKRRDEKRKGKKAKRRQRRREKRLVSVNDLMGHFSKK